MNEASNPAKLAVARHMDARTNRVRKLGAGRRQLSRRDFLKLGGIVSASALLAACGPTRRGIATSIVFPRATPSSTPTRTPTATPSPTATATPTATPASPTLRTYGEEAGLSIGTAIDAPVFRNTKWQGVVSSEFNLVTVHWGVYWIASQPTSETLFDFRTIDQQVAFAQEHNLRMRGHPLVWRNIGFLPDWIRDEAFSKAQMTRIIKNHVETLVERYRGKITEWVVVNEYRDDDHVFARVLGEDYVEIAFQAARNADPSAVLIYNDDDNQTYEGVHFLGTRQIIRQLMAKGLVDGVGLQMHLDGAHPPNKDRVSQAMYNYGLPVYVTEFDVDLENVDGTQDERFSKQAKIYRDMLEACLASGACKSFTTWGIGDMYSWYANPRAEATLFDDNLDPKPAFYAMMDVLSGSRGAHNSLPFAARNRHDHS